jgi:hypothetical protein
MKSESSPTTTGSVLLAPSAADFSKYDLMYYIKGAASGGICCSITHGALTPVDVVKTRVQLDSVKVCIPSLFFLLEFNCLRFLSCRSSITAQMSFAFYRVILFPSFLIIITTTAHTHTHTRIILIIYDMMFFLLAP